MSEPFDGLELALMRIAEEAEARTGFLDLGGLGLVTLPPELFRLRHLRELNLGAGLRRSDGSHHRAYDPHDADAVRNNIDTKNFGDLRKLPDLVALSVSATAIADLTRLAGLVALQSLDCSVTQVADLTPLAGFVALQSLDCRFTQVADLTPLAGLVALQSLVCLNTQVADLTPLAGLVALQSLACGGTRVADLTPLASLLALQSLDCTRTQVADLTPLAGLVALQSLVCSGTRVADLTPLARLVALQSLDCWDTQVADLAPLAGLVALQSLDCSFTQVADLTPLVRLVALQSLDCSFTQVADLTPLAGLVALQSLACTRTQVADLTPLAGLVALQSLDCRDTQVADLTPLASLPSLRKLDCSHCAIRNLPQAIYDLPSLRELTLLETRIPGVPAEALSQSNGDNCLAAVRAHFRDLEAGVELVADMKLIVLGNGRVGKTQICRRLRGERYDSDEPSTHGILVTSAILQGSETLTRLNIWDFGGQDLYHGTHALFLCTSAVFLLVWARETENASVHEYQGVTFQNQPLTYWLAYVRHLAGTVSPVLIVQTRCDRPQDEALAPPVSEADMAGFGHRVSLHYSALNDRKREVLDGALREAVGWLREHHGVAEIGIGRMQVQRALQAMRDADAAVPPQQRQYRTITQEHFRRLCDEAGNVSSPGELLRFLHNTGIVFYRQGLFEDRIVLDQGWALEAIYAVFSRDKCWRELKRLRGRFTRPLLELLVWGGHSIEEQKLFLDMMRSCGICFVHRTGPDRDDDSTEYIAPDLLPERGAVEDDLNAMWDAEQPSEIEEFEFEMLHPGLARGLICEIGGEAGVAALYGRGGVCAYETTTRSHALIEQQDMQDAWHGRIRVQTQGGQFRLLLDRLAAWIERRSGHSGLRAARIGAHGLPAAIVEAAERDSAKSGDADTVPGTFGAAPVAATEYFVSYAWGDDMSPEAREREDVVDRLCAEAETRGVHIIRDKTTLRTGDRIAAFMRRIGTGDRVFVVLSEKYLRSPYCMFELCEIWRHSRGDEADFRRRVSTYALPDANARTPIERIRLAADWKTQHDEIAALIKEHGGEIVGSQDFERFKLMGDFYRNVPDILATMFDTVQPHNFEELVQHGFGAAPSG
ncbi:MAG TPA: leucine-rich repeat domain-containing protein [Acetobacteraceae bacterium]|nr:leucine-rich repeat domain-containing protein [Acetobacteraceae bacterium]